MQRATKIVVTLGPACSEPVILSRMLAAGVDVVRLNFSHGQASDHIARATLVRSAAKALGREVAIMADLQGPKIRVGKFAAGRVTLATGARFVLDAECESGDEARVGLDYKELPRDVAPGAILLLDDGLIRLKVESVEGPRILTRVEVGGVLSNNKGINRLGGGLTAPALTAKDMEDMKTAAHLEADYIAVSFPKNKEDMYMARQLLRAAGGHALLIAKIERAEAIGALDEIIEASDGIMVARGDLGMECPFEELPIIQRRVVKQCIIRGKPVIVATHMLESMIENPSPTRAEITDVSNAVYEQTDAIMLSGETSVGRYPVKCIEIMDRIAQRVERSGGANYAEMARMDSLGAKMVKSAYVLSKEVNAEALIVFTRKGSMARNAAWLRPLHSPIYAFTDNPELLNQLTLHWGITPFLIEFGANPESNFERAVKTLKERGLVHAGNSVVAVTEVDVGGRLIDTILMETVE